MRTFTTAQDQLGMSLFDVGAIQFGQFRLKLHDTKPDAQLSPIFLNLRTPDNPKPGPLTPALVDEIGHELSEIARALTLNFTYVAGVPRAGTPFARTFSQAFAEKAVPLLHLDKDETAGRRRVATLRESDYQKGAGVLLIDDLITKADSKIEAIEVLRNAGLVVRDVLVLVDREQGGAKQLEEAGCHLHSVFPLSALLELYVLRGKMVHEKQQEVLAYLAANR